MYATGAFEIIEDFCTATGFDQELGRSVFGTYLKQSREILKCADLELESMREDAYEKIARHMHKLAGSSGNIRAFQLMQMAKEVEQMAIERDVTFIAAAVEDMIAILYGYSQELEEGDL